MAITALPTIPFLIFGIVEPVMLVWAFLVGNRNPKDFFTDQTPTHPLSGQAFTPQAEILTYTLMNLYAFCAALAVVCTWTTRAQTVRYYILAAALADLGHIHATYRGMGGEVFWNLSQWNQMTWANVGITGFLFVNRVTTGLGLYGRVR